MIHTNANDVHILTGDFNEMDIRTIDIDLEIDHLVKDQTRRTNILDKFPTNLPYLFHVAYKLQSLVKTKHKAVLVNCDKTTSNGDKTFIPRTTIDGRVYSHVVGNVLCQSFCNYNWSTIRIDAQSYIYIYIYIYSNCMTCRSDCTVTGL